jgi:MFS family permease
MSTMMEPSPLRRPGAVVALLCGAEIASMLGAATYAALLPDLQAAWGLSHASTGFVSGAYYGGYLIGVPGLVGLTDRIDSRRIYVLSALLSAAGALGMAGGARGLWSACFWQAVAGPALPVPTCRDSGCWPTASKDRSRVAPSRSTRRATAWG